MLAQLIQFPADRARKPGECVPRRVTAELHALSCAYTSAKSDADDLAFWLAWWFDTWRVAVGLKPIFHDIYAGGEKPCDS